MKWIWVCICAMALPVSAQTWIYQDALGTGWQNWSWSGTFNFSCAAPVYSGTYSISATLEGWGALSLYHAALTRSDYGALEFYVRGASNNIQIWLSLENSGSGQSSDSILLNNAAYLSGGTIDTGSWKRALIPLSAFSGAPSAFTRVNVYNNSAAGLPALYFDSIRLTGASELPPGLTSAHAEAPSVAAAYFDQTLATNSLPFGRYILRNTADPNYAAGVTGVYTYYRADVRGVAAAFPFAFQSAGVYQLSVAGITNLGGLAVNPPVTGRFALATVGLQVNVTTDVHRISPYIYGLAFGPDTNYLRGAGITVNRSGGNRRSKYNWRKGVSNTGADWYYENVQEDSGPAGEDSGRDFAVRNCAAGCATIMTLPTLAWVAKDSSSHSYSIAKYGAQDDADYSWRPDAGNGLRGGVAITTNDPNDALVPSRPYRRVGDPTNCVYQDEWLQSLRAELGPLTEDTVTFIAVDNEPDIWSGTHQDAHPAASTYDELLEQFLTYAGMTRSNWPRARITGPVSTGWWYYWNSEAGWDDKAAHGDQDFLPWFLDRVREHDTNAGVRTLDVLDLHYYPTLVYNSNADTNTRALRLRAPRAFWDPSYRDEGWIGSDSYATQTQSNRNYVQLIPRFQQLIAAHYPGTKLGITEWCMGAEGDISGGLAVADTLGILGRERVELATYWANPVADSAVYQAFKLFGNYNAAGARFAPISVSATSTAPYTLSLYAAVSPSGDRLTLLVVNKDSAKDILASFNLAAYSPSATAQVYSLDALAPSTLIQPPATTNVSANFQMIFHAYSATLILLSGPVLDGNGDGLPDPWCRAYAVNDPVADDDGDGARNLDEYLGDTDPRDSNSVFRVRLHGGASNLWLGVSSSGPQRYRLESASAPNAAWTPSSTQPGNASALLWRQTLASSGRVFRVQRTE